MSAHKMPATLQTATLRNRAYKAANSTTGHNKTTPNFRSLNKLSPKNLNDAEKRPNKERDLKKAPDTHSAILYPF